MATTVTLQLPNEIANRLKAKWNDLPRAALESLIADAYRSELLSADQVRKLLGFRTRIPVDEFLKRHGVSDYTIEDFEQDQATLRGRA